MSTNEVEELSRKLNEMKLVANYQLNHTTLWFGLMLILLVILYKNIR